jgi:hypothetical protein
MHLPRTLYIYIYIYIDIYIYPCHKCIIKRAMVFLRLFFVTENYFGRNRVVKRFYVRNIY